MESTIGYLVIVFGLLCILVGDRNVPIKNGGVILKLFSSSKTVGKWRKWFIGLGAIYAGVMILKHAAALSVG